MPTSTEGYDSSASSDWGLWLEDMAEQCTSDDLDSNQQNPGHESHSDALTNMSDEQWCQAMSEQESCVQEWSSPVWNRALEIVVAHNLSSDSQKCLSLENTASKEIARRWLSTLMPYTAPILSGLIKCINTNDFPSSFYVDDKINPSAIVMISFFPEKSLSIFSLYSEQAESLIASILVPGQPIVFTHVDELVIEPMLIRCLENSMNLRLLRRINKTMWVLQTDSTINVPELMENSHYGKLSLINMGCVTKALMDIKEQPSMIHISASIEHNLSACIFVDNALASWCIADHNCAIQLVYTRPEFRRRGFGTAVVAKMIHIIQEKRGPMNIFYSLVNPASHGVFWKTLGWKQVCCSNWLHFEPV